MATVKIDSESDYLYLLTALADRQGVFHSPQLDVVQRMALTYLVFRERKEQKEKSLDDFKLALLAAHPERASDILDEASKTGTEVAPALTDEQLDFEPGMNSAELDYAVGLFSDAGFVVEEIPDPPTWD